MIEKIVFQIGLIFCVFGHHLPEVYLQDWTHRRIDVRCSRCGAQIMMGKK